MYNENQLYSMGDSAHCSLVTYMGRKPRKEGTYVCIKLIHVAIQQTLTQHCKAIILQSKLEKKRMGRQFDCRAYSHFVYPRPLPSTSPLLAKKKGGELRLVLKETGR